MCYLIQLYVSYEYHITLIEDFKLYDACYLIYYTSKPPYLIKCIHLSLWFHKIIIIETLIFFDLSGIWIETPVDLWLNKSASAWVNWVFAEW